MPQICLHWMRKSFFHAFWLHFGSWCSMLIFDENPFICLVVCITIIAASIGLTCEKPTALNWISFFGPHSKVAWVTYEEKKLISEFKKYRIWFTNVPKGQTLATHACSSNVAFDSLTALEALVQNFTLWIHLKSDWNLTHQYFHCCLYCIRLIAISHSNAKIFSFGKNMNSDCGGGCSNKQNTRAAVSANCFPCF